MANKYWLLPEDVIELLPKEAAHVESLRRQILDQLASWGYQLVMPPLVEYLDSLLAGSGDDLDIQTSKVTDHLSGRLMGIRADMTPQIARIDAHRLPTSADSRYGYCGEVLRNRSESTEPRRNPLIAGAELFGVSGVSGDVEIIALLLSILENLDIKHSVIDLGHAGIFSGLVMREGLSVADRYLLADIFAGKKRPDLAEWQVDSGLSDQLIEDVQHLIDAHGQDDPLQLLETRFAGVNAEFDRAIVDLERSQSLLSAFYPQQAFTVDLGTVGSYGYHSGLVFACYAAGHYGTIARGGRYDGIGAAYGRARPATGFSADLLTLAQLSNNDLAAVTTAATNFPADAAAFAAIQARRAAGERIHFEHEEDL